MLTSAEAVAGEAELETYLAAHQQKELVRFVVVGSVDDGKSTFIGRLLYETHGLYEDQVAQVRRASKQGGDEIDLSLFTDGLKAEREQAITIDVAYRYFSTPGRKYIIADTPGHVQYTRNMATGASTADVAVILVDARYGLLPQGRRHAYIAALLGIPELVVAVNKMDLVEYDQATFEKLRAEFSAYAGRLGFKGLHFFPVSARKGDNVVRPSERMPWHSGGTVLEFLERVSVQRNPALEKWRFPVQYVLRPHLDYRGFAGQVSSGRVAVGDEVVVLPSGRRTRIKGIDTYDGLLDSAAAPLSVTLRLADEVDVSRGDLLVHPADVPRIRRRLDARLIWFSEAPLDVSRDYLLKHGTRVVPARVSRVESRTDLETLAPVPVSELIQNDIGQVAIDLRRPIVADAYAENRHTGAFILIDPVSNNTLAAGMVLDSADGSAAELGEDASASQVPAEERARRLGHRAALVVVDVAEEASARAQAFGLERALFTAGVHCVVSLAESAAAVALSEAGLVVIVPLRGELAARERQRAALRVSGHAVVEAGEDQRTTVELVRERTKL